jgi:4,5-dihydroxyphthalate decarboxylase
VADLRLSLAISDYIHTSDIVTGRIKPVGIELIVNSLPFEQAAFRFGANLEFDISEYSMANYCARVAAPDPAPMVALPVFPSRMFRHSSIYVNAAAGITSLKDLAGKKVGIPQWSQTATIYVRGYLMHHAGVPLSAVHWVQAGLDQAGRRDPVQSRLPQGVVVEQRPDNTLSAMLALGEIDAAITARPPRCFEAGDKRVKRLFVDYRTHDAAYFRQTGIFPIMHVLAMRRSVYEANRWIARNLFNAFEEAKRAAVERLRNLQTSYAPTAWAPHDFDEASRLIFPNSEPWPYGLEHNRATLDPFLAYCHEQGVAARKVTSDELFPKELLFEVIV